MSERVFLPLRKLHVEKKQKKKNLEQIDVYNVNR